MGVTLYVDNPEADMPLTDDDLAKIAAKLAPIIEEWANRTVNAIRATEDLVVKRVAGEVDRRAAEIIAQLPKPPTP